MKNKHLNDHDRIGICLAIAEAMLEADCYEVETITDKYDNQHYAEDTQDRFNGYFDVIEGILHDHGLIDWEG